MSSYYYLQSSCCKLPIQTALQTDIFAKPYNASSAFQPHTSDYNLHIQLADLFVSEKPIRSFRAVPLAISTSEINESRCHCKSSMISSDFLSIVDAIALVDRVNPTVLQNHLVSN